MVFAKAIALGQVFDLPLEAVGSPELCNTKSGGICPLNSKRTLKCVFGPEKA